MRLLFIANDFPTPCDPTDGIFNLNLARALAAEHDVDVIAPVPWIEKWKSARPAREFGTNVEPQVIDGLRVFYPTYYYPPKMLRQWYGAFFWRSIRGSVERALESRTPDAVIGYWIHPDGAAAVRVGRRLGVPSMVLVGGSDLLLLPKSGSRRRCIERVLYDADAVLTVSDQLRSKALELGLSPRKVHTWRQGVNVSRFCPGDQSEARRKLGMPGDLPVLLWVGRMDPVKALEVLIDAAAMLHTGGVRFRLCLVGDGPQRAAIESRVREKGLVDEVLFAGMRPQEQLPDWYRAADVMVLPSRSEGLPNVLREAAACGTPFVASNVGGIAEIADPRVDALVPAGDARALADALRNRLDRVDGVEPAAVTPRSYSWADSARALVGILDPLVARGRDPDRPWWIDSRRREVSGSSRPNPLRQMARRAMSALLPRRMFLTRGPTGGGGICLTFDDGPHPVNTPRVLDVLREHGVKATFFVVGRLAERWPEIVRRMSAEGHQVANHTQDHTRRELLDGAEMMSAVRRGGAVLEAIAGERARCVRPPGGKIGWMDAIRLWRDGQTIALWNVDPKDYQCGNAAELEDRLRSHELRAGDIVLLHDRLPLAAEALPGVIARARGGGLGFCRLDEWLRPNRIERAGAAAAVSHA